MRCPGYEVQTQEQALIRLLSQEAIASQAQVGGRESASPVPMHPFPTAAPPPPPVPVQEPPIILSAGHGNTGCG